MHLYLTAAYERAIRKLLSEDERTSLETAVLAAPASAPIMPGTGGMRKIRWAGSGRGKRGGIRVVYFWIANPDAIYMLGAFAKAKRADLTAAERKTLSQLVATIKRERSNGDGARTN